MVWTGDINADFLRESVHTKAVADTLTDLGLTRSWDRYNVDFTCYHDILGEFSTSVIDHFFWNEPVVDAVVDAGVLHLVDKSLTIVQSIVYLILQSLRLIEHYPLDKSHDHHGERQA